MPNRDPRPGSGVECRVGGLKSGCERAKAAADGDPTGRLGLVKNSKGSGMGRKSGGIGVKAKAGTDGNPQKSKGWDNGGGSGSCSGR